MARGGPTIGGAWAEGYSRARENAIADTRYRLAEGLRIQKELRANEEAIASETLKMKNSQALYEQAQAELDIIHKREGEIRDYPGDPYKRGAATQGKIFEAQENLDDAISRLKTHETELQKLTQFRDNRIRDTMVATPGWRGFAPGWAGGTTPIKKLPGGKEGPPLDKKPGDPAFSIHTPYKDAVRAAEMEGGQTEAGKQNLATQQAIESELEQLDPAVSDVQKFKSRLGGLEKAEEVGAADQQAINEKERRKELFPLEEKAEAQRARGLEAQGSIEAAAQELAARRRENQFIQSQQVPGGGGQGTGLLGLLGSLINKAGGGPGGGTMGSPGGSGGGAFGGKAGAAPRPQAPPGGAQRMQSGQGGAPTPPQRPMTPMFGQGGAPTPPVRPPGLGGAQPTAMRQELSPSKFAPPGYQGAAGQAAPNIPTPPPRPPGIGVPTVREAIDAAAQHPIMNVPINQVPAALTQLLGHGQSPPPGTSGSVSLGGAQTYPQGPYPPGPMRPQGPPGGAQAAPSMTPGGPAPGAQPGAYGQQVPLPPPRPQMPSQAAAPYSPPYGEPGGPGSVILGGRGNVAPGSATSVTLPGVGGEGALRPPPAVTQAPPARPPAMPPQRPLDIDPYPRPGFKSAQAETGFRPIRGEVGDFPPSYRAAIGGGAVSPYQPMPPPAPRPQPPAPQAGAAGGGVSAQARQAIANIESRGSGDYRAINKKSGAVGRYQIMPRNVPSWTKQALGRAMTPQQLAASPQAQDAVFNHIFGGYMQKYGARGAAIKWNTGKAPQERPPSAAGLAYARKFEREGGLGGHGRAAGFHDISGEASDIPGIGGAADRASGAGRALTPEALAAPLPLRSAATNVRQLNPGLLSAVTSGANRFMADNPGYKVRVNEGFNTQGHTKFSHHHNGTAMDIQVIGPDGKDIPNRGNDPSGIYRKLASSVYGSAPAGVKEKLGWGGAFETSPGSGTQDLMHFDLGGDRGNLAPNFRLAALGGGEGGATPAAMAGGETPSATTETTETSGTGADRQQARQQQAYQPPPPPEMPEEPPHQQQAPWQPQQPIAAAPGRQKPQIGPPTVHDEREIAGMKPGSIFRTPDGRLKVVPIQPLQRPQQASYASQ